MSILEVKALKKYYPVRGKLFSREKRCVHAVDGVDFDIKEREVFGLAGESGCGKTTIARLILRFLEPTSGMIRYHDLDISRSGKTELSRFREEVQMVFQDPCTSSNPRKTVRKILARPFEIHRKLEKEEVEEEVAQLLNLINLKPPEFYLDRYPHEFSGGQLQRIGIARAIALRPKLVVADEPVSSLDLSVRAQILDLMITLQKDLGMSYLFITHDLSVLRAICNRVAIMYLGRILELADVDDLYDKPLHPYTQALLSATPVANPRETRRRQRRTLVGDVPSPIDLPSGCRFRTRCFECRHECSIQEPELSQVSKGHFVACNLYA